ncbi:hypothetical protein Fleli_2016 [Bernardetia litoralis DSM 6794]|uniref:DUF983 domain-containing protein n=1 Tax=Bernardetia litoralis (strain ATCC 23117 / DSM 6794 / NBRC 15988 / NCIMB 1366 / Fx l1 / Sio-4) TaxID=880071 RepID=I4AKB5_BERLS|nr:DUF983 domain-containing protein [Bernardetia litoralis]AFM04400.1 hypothetical protein Fleli_2016 [Bernardetia litoralis DSM 6794]
MEKERSKSQAILQCKCPRCRKGDIFEKAAFSINFAKTYRNCSVCNLKYERTMGFWWSAMYMSYAFTVAHLITVMVAINILTQERPALWVFFTAILGTFMFLVPVYFRYARTLVLYLLGGVKYSSNPEVWEEEGE